MARGWRNADRHCWGLTLNQSRNETVARHGLLGGASFA